MYVGSRHDPQATCKAVWMDQFVRPFSPYQSYAFEVRGLRFCRSLCGSNTANMHVGSAVRCDAGQAERRGAATSAIHWLSARGVHLV
eukprot:3328130-Prymnesium_polylepis.1